jgi:hypothetical protein
MILISEIVTHPQEVQTIMITNLQKLGQPKKMMMMRMEESLD